MRIIYLHIMRSILRGIKDQGYSFDSEWNFTMNESQLVCKKEASPPKGLWEGGFSDSSAAGKVTAVSAIIGKNGAGKTSVACMLGTLCKLGRPDPIYLLVFEDGGIYTAYTNSDRTLEDSIPKRLLGQSWGGICSEHTGWSPSGLMFDFLYLTPFCANEKLWDTPQKRVFDLSSASYIDDAGSKGKVLQEYSRGERHRILTFTKVVNDRYPGNIHCEINLPWPRKAWIRYNVKAVFECRACLADNQRNGNQNTNATGELLGKIGKTMCIHDLDDHWLNFFVGVASAYLMNVFHDIGKNLDTEGFQDIGRMADIGAYIFDRIDANRIKSFEEIARTQDIGYRLSYGWSNTSVAKRKELQQQIVLKIRENAKIYRNDSFVKWKNLDEFCTKLFDAVSRHGDADNPGIVTFAISSQKDFGELSWFVVKQDEFDLDLVTVEFQNLSSGEMAYLGMLSRLYDAFAMIGLAWRKDGQVKDVIPRRPVVVFLDEAETTMHPKWQRELVHVFIWFVEKFTVGADVQFVFASHSPLLLSDIPRGNVCFLGTAGLTDETYGANIYDLYKNVYSLTDGVTGVMAQERLNALARMVMDVVKKVPQAQIVTKDDWKVVEIIGDPHIKRYFESLKELIEVSQGVEIR